MHNSDFLGSGRMSTGTTFYSKGCSLLLRSRFHEDLFFYPDGTSSFRITETEREIRRRLFWLYYEYGLYVAFILVFFSFKIKGQPPLLPEDIYRGSLPMDDESFNMIASLERKYGPSFFMQNDLDGNIENKVYPIPFPLQDDSKNEVAPGALSHLMKIMKVFEKIMILNRSSIDGTMDKRKLNMLRSQIDLSLVNWHQSFNIWLTNSSFRIIAGNSSLPTAPWMSTFLEVIFHFCIICIHRPLIWEDFLKINDYGSLTLFTHPSCPILESSAAAISSVLQKNDFANFLMNVPSFTHTILFHLGLTLGMLLYVSPHSPNCNRYIREIDSCMSALSTISKYFSPTRNKWDVLRKIAATFYRKKTHEEISSQLALLRESTMYGYPLIGSYVTPVDMEEYSKSRKILREHRLEFIN
jgi:hypothetical protein